MLQAIEEAWGTASSAVYSLRASATTLASYAGRSSLPAHGTIKSQGESWRWCSSQTSSIPRRVAASGTAAGAPCWMSTTGSCGESSSASEDGRSRPRATAPSRPSMDPRARSVERKPSFESFSRSTSSCPPGSTRGRSRDGEDIVARRPTSALGWGRRRRSARFRTVRDPVVGSDLEFVGRGTQVLKGVPGDWRLFALEPSSG
jgi:hypothetical protein